MSNPILLQLGVITGKKRRRRDTDADFPHVPNLRAAEAEAVQQKLKEIALLERFMTQVHIPERALFAFYVPEILQRAFLNVKLLFP